MNKVDLISYIHMVQFILCIAWFEVRPYPKHTDEQINVQINVQINAYLYALCALTKSYLLSAN